MFPWLAGVPGCMAYIEYFLQQSPRWEEVDKNGGLAPQHWIDNIRQAVERVYTCLSGKC